jgi:hypothetical protein
LGDAEKEICLQLFDIWSFSGRKLGFNVFQKITQKNSQKMKISNFFLFIFNKFMLSECSRPRFRTLPQSILKRDLSNGRWNG